MASETCWRGSIKQAMILENVWKATAHCIASARVHFGKSEITWRAMPASHILMLEVRIGNGAFSHCKRETAERCTVGIDFEQLLTMLRPLRLRKQQELDIVVAPNCGKVKLRSAAGGRECRVELYTMDVSTVETEPDVDVKQDLGEYPYVVTMRCKDVVDMKKQLVAVSAECVRFSVEYKNGAYRVVATSCDTSDESDGDTVKTARRVLRVGGCLADGQKREVQHSPMIRVALLVDFLKGRACSEEIEVMCTPIRQIHAYTTMHTDSVVCRRHTNADPVVVGVAILGYIQCMGCPCNGSSEWRADE